MVSETLVVFNEMTRVISRENFINVSRREIITFDNLFVSIYSYIIHQIQFIC
jgi:hypothetical protein